MRNLLALVLLGCAPGVVLAGGAPNGDFDTGISGWTYVGHPSGSISWEPADGSPNPGSLRLQFAGSGLAEVQAYSPFCENVAPGELWVADTRVKSDGVRCSIQALAYDGANCTGLEADVEPRGHSSANTWTTVSLPPIDAGDAGLASISFRLLLEPSLSQQGPATCLFDSVHLFQTNQSVVEVPAADAPGLALLALFLAAAACGMLRRRSARGSRQGA